MATESSVMGVIRASRPNFRNPRHDKIAYAVHSSFLAAGYSLIATGHNAASNNPPTDGDEVGVDGWNELDDGYAFMYTKTVKGSKVAVLVKCMVIGDILAIDVLNLKEENKEPFNLQINVKDYSEDGTTVVNNYGQMYKNFKDLVEKLNVGILAKLEPVEGSSSTHSSGRSEHVTSNNEYVGVFPSQHNPQLRQSNIVYPPIPAFGGNSDLYPGPGAGFYPQGGSGFSRGMLVGPNDPRWFSSGQRPGFLGDIPGAPPGSRYDPIGPPDVPGFEPGRLVRQPPRRPGDGTHPDLEHFQGPDYI